MTTEGCGNVLGHGMTCSGQANDPYLCDTCRLKLKIKKLEREADLSKKIWDEIGKKSDAVRDKNLSLALEIKALRDILKHGHTDNNGIICGENGRYDCEACRLLSTPYLPEDSGL